MQFKRIFYFIPLLCLALLSSQASAQSFSYVYIQGDKQTPFYVKLEDEMQPRYGKNYSIISRLAPGAINIEILFQQNIYPSQKFTIRVPENSYRGFLLSHKGNAFSLYDIQQQFYLPAGNSLEDDHMPETDPGKNFVTTNNPVTTATTTPAPEPIIKTKTKKTVNKKVPVEKTIVSTTPQFIENVELNGEKTIQNAHPDAVINTSADTNSVVTTTVNKTNIPNSDCPKPMTRSVFEDIYDKTEKRSDKNKLRFLLGKLDLCYTSAQVRILTKQLSDDPERFEFLKQVYPHVTDQSNYAALGSLLSTREWKDQFLQIIQ